MQAIPCANTSALRAYERQQDESDRRAEWIEKEAEKQYAWMLPLSASDLDEAVTEVMARPMKGRDDPHAEQRTAIFAAFAGNDDAALGKAMRAAVKAYWLGYHTQQAADDYDDGAAEADYGRY